MKKQLKGIWKYIEGANGIILILYSIFIFSTFAYTEAGEYGGFWKWIIVIVVASIVICPLILKGVRKINVRPYQETSNTAGDASTSHKDNHRTCRSLLWAILFFVIPFLLFLAKYLIYYPTAASPDTIVQYTQAVTNQYNDWHPMIQTLLAIKIPLLVTGGWIGSMTLFQIIAFSLVLSYALSTVRKYTHTIYAILVMAFFLLNPQTTNMAMFPWKDVSFSMGALLLVTYVLRIYFTDGAWIKKYRNMICFAIAFVLTTLFRHNALLFTIPLLIAVILLLIVKRTDKTAWKPLLITAILAAILFAAIKIPLYSALKVESPDQRNVETLGLPMTVIGANITYAPEEQTVELKEFAYKVAPKEVWEELYTYGDYNAVKWDERTDNDVIETYGTQKVLTMTLDCFRNSPYTSTKALIKLTNVTYTVCDQYKYYDLPWIYANEVGITQQGIPRLQDLNARITDAVYRYLPWPFMYVGVMHLILLIAILGRCRLNKWDGWKKILLILPVFLYNFGTALLLTGAGDSSRFFYYTFLLTPLYLVLLFREVKERSTDAPVRKTL